MTHEHDYQLNLVQQVHDLIEEHNLLCLELEWNPSKNEDYIFVTIHTPLNRAHRVLDMFVDELPVYSAFVTHNRIEFRIDSRPNGGYHDQ